MAKGKQRAAPKRKTKPAKRKPPSKPKAKRKRTKPAASDAVPIAIAESPSTDTSTRRRARTAREWAARSSPVVEILDDPHPSGALRRFLEGIRGTATQQQSQIALGAAQLMLLPIARENRGGAEVKEVVDLVLERWGDFAERRTGFHAREFLRNAFAAIGVDRDRIARLETHVPVDASGDLLFSVACAHAVARDKVALLRSVEAALEAGATVDQFRRDGNFTPYRNDPDFSAILARAELPPIPVDLGPYLSAVRAALETLVGTLREYGQRVELRPPVRLDAILDAERARKISLPNDYRALLTITNGLVAFGHEFFGVGDYREPTMLARNAQRYLQMSAEQGAPGIEECVPLANLGADNSWLLYDPRGKVRGGEPGYVAMLPMTRGDLGRESDLDRSVTRGSPDQRESLVAVLDRLGEVARDALGTN